MNLNITAELSSTDVRNILIESLKRQFPLHDVISVDFKINQTFGFMDRPTGWSLTGVDVRLKVKGEV